jgi:hypothetical protein
MKQIPDSVFKEMMAITGAMKDMKANSTKCANTIRKANLLHKKLQKLKDKQ